MVRGVGAALGAGIMPLTALIHLCIDVDTNKLLEISAVNQWYGISQACS